MIDFELWKNEILDSINQLHEEAKLIREHFEEENEEENEEEEINTEEDEVEDLQEVLEDEDYESLNLDEENETIIIEKLDEINDNLNTINKTVIEGSIVISITIIIALAFHYFINQISKW